VPGTGFTHFRSNGDKTGTKKRFLDPSYLPASIYPKNFDLTIPKWHVEYHFYNPLTRKKERFKVYEDINRFKGVEKIQFALNLKDAVNIALKSGYNPFSHLVAAKEEEEKTKEGETILKPVEQTLVKTVTRNVNSNRKTDAQVKAEKLKVQQDNHNKDFTGARSHYTIPQAFNYFLTEKKEKGKAPATISRYKTAIEFLTEYLDEKGMLQAKAYEIKAAHLLNFLKEYSDTKKWGNKTYNNHLGSLQVIFNFLALNIHGVIEKNPIEGAEYKNTLSTKHTAYSNLQLQNMLKKVREKEDLFMEGIILTVYYAAIRAKAELRDFKISNILFDRDLIRLDAEGTKGRRDDYIPLDPVLKEFFIKHNLDKLPKDWYVFGNKNQPGPVKAGANHYSMLFKTYRDEAELSDIFTLYGFKHTRAVDLATAGVDIYAIMQLFRHQNLDDTMTYLRDLGCTINRKATENSRVI
jgi:site-specific recombinase XerD